MVFPESFFEDEVRDGFYVPGMMKRAWAAELEILSEIDRICKKHGIRWYMAYGTLLGAVRHRGFIPWDDDMDINMLRKDYERFCEVANQELPDGMVFRALQLQDDHEKLISAVGLTRHPLFFGELEKYHDFPFSAAIDICVVDRLSPNPEEERVRRDVCTMLTVLEQELGREGESQKEAVKRLAAEIYKVERLLKIRFRKDRPMRIQLQRLLDRMYSQYEEGQGKEYAWMPEWCAREDQNYPAEWLEELIELPFENTVFPAPSGYDGMLRAEYGDYLKKSSAGGAHSYPWYKRYEEPFKEKFGEKWCFRYSFSREDLLHSAPENLREQCLLGAELLLETGKRLAPMLEKTEENREPLQELLSDCQETAIYLGGKIEEEKGEGTEAVHCLEQYCEAVYRCYQLLSEPGAEEEKARLKSAAEGLSKYILLFREELHSLFLREIVFLPDRAAHWASLEGLWREAVRDPELAVRVIPVPYFYRRGDGSFGEQHYDGALFPEEVEITDYREYDFGRNLPDCILLNSPYDSCHYTMSIDPFFYAGNMKKFTRRLFYVPWFVTDEIDPEKAEDGKALVNMEHYVTVPGLFHADRSFLQSENMRRTYLQQLCKFAGEETREIWEQKLCAAGSGLYDGTELEAVHGGSRAVWEKIRREL